MRFLIPRISDPAEKVEVTIEDTGDRNLLFDARGNRFECLSVWYEFYDKARGEMIGCVQTPKAVAQDNPQVRVDDIVAIFREYDLNFGAVVVAL
jgi:hypothetical protein